MINFREKNKELINDLKNRGINKKILQAIEKSPRHLFVPKKYQQEAYEDRPLPIGYSATISQPYTVAFMLQILDVKKGNKVLEIGTGSGWNASLLSILVGKNGKVYTIEIIPELVKFAKNNLKKLKIENVEVVEGDGSKGYKKHSPYDRIIVTAACPSLPKPLIEQLKTNGILIAPIGPSYSQKMLKIIKKKNKLIEQNLGDFMFVPLKGKYGFS